jgi:hypothetical protein
MTRILIVQGHPDSSTRHLGHALDDIEQVARPGFARHRSGMKGS